MNDDPLSAARGIALGCLLGVAIWIAGIAIVLWGGEVSVNAEVWVDGRTTGTHLMRYRRRNIYLALEDLDLVWDEQDVLEFDRMWCEGLSVPDIARAFRRDVNEVVALAMDRALKDKITPRPYGAYGKGWRL